jgi:hypothetical protein
MDSATARSSEWAKNSQSRSGKMTALPFVHELNSAMKKNIMTLTYRNNKIIFLEKTSVIVKYNV